MVRKELRINGVNIPLSNDISVPVNKSIKDISEPYKSKSDYTKTIRLPFSKELNKLLTFIFEINANGDFNPNKKADAIYLEDSIEVIRGYFQLKDVILNDENIEYEGVIFGETSDFFTNISNLYLNEIQGLDEFNHSYSSVIQRLSWNTSYVQNNANQPFELGKGYVYPLINYGNDSDLNEYKTNELFPSFYTKELIDRIFKDAGYTYDSSFLESDRFKKEIIPFSGLNFGLTKEQIQQRVFEANTPTTSDSTFNLDTNGDVINLQYSNEVQDLGNVHNSTLGSYTVSNDGKYNVVASLAVSMRFRHLDNNVDVVINEPYKAILRIRRNGNIVASDRIYIHPPKTFVFSSPGTYTTSVNPTYPSNEYSREVLSDGTFVENDKLKPNELRSILSEVDLLQGDNITVELYMISNNVLNTFVGVNTPQTFSGEFDVFTGDGKYFNRVVNTNIMINDTLNMSQAVPEDVKQLDFITSILNKFNLYVQPKRENPKELTILPRDEFFTSDVVDWSDKLDISKDLVYKPMGLLDANKYVFSFDTDNDYYNKLYLEQYNLNYGAVEVDIDNDFIKRESNNKLIFASTPSVGQSYNDLVVPSILKVDSNNVAGRYKGKIRSLVYGGLIQTQTVWQHDGVGFTEYPYCGHFDHPFTPTFDSNFDLPKEIYYDNTYNDITLTDDNLYNRYHRKGIEEITDKNSKIVEGYFYLTPYDLAILDFRKQYYFKGAYFRLQSVVDYDGNSGNTTKCVFLKLNVKEVFEPTFETATGGNNVSVGKSLMPTINNTESDLQNNNSYNSKIQTVQGDNNIIDKSAKNVNVIGSDNVVSSRTTNVNIQGNNNYIEAGLKNISIVNSDNLTVTESNVNYVNGTKVESNTDFHNGKYKVLESEEITITENKQMVVFNNFDLKGILNIKGQLILK